MAEEPACEECGNDLGAYHYGGRDLCLDCLEDGAAQLTFADVVPFEPANRLPAVPAASQTMETTC